MDELDKKLNEAFEGRVVRKDLLHRIKKGTNVPTFVLEFLLARYCASNEPEEIQAGMEAVLATLQDNYVRPDEANAAQSRVAMKGKHKFIDKVHVRYVEKEKRHWAALENFASQRIAIGEKFYRDNDRLLEGGIWAEVTVAHNAIGLWAIGAVYGKLRGVEAMGMGDVKMMAMVGAFTGPWGVVFTIFAASLVGAVVGVLLIPLRGRSMQDTLPFGCFLAPAALAALLIGRWLVEAYFGLLRVPPPLA